MIRWYGPFSQHENAHASAGAWCLTQRCPGISADNDPAVRCASSDWKGLSDDDDSFEFTLLRRLTWLNTADVPDRQPIRSVLVTEKHNMEFVEKLFLVGVRRAHWAFCGCNCTHCSSFGRRLRSEECSGNVPAASHTCGQFASMTSQIIGWRTIKWTGGSVAEWEWLACWTQAQKGPGSNRSRVPIVPLFTKQQNW